MTKRSVSYVLLGMVLLMVATCGRSQDSAVAAGMSCDHHTRIRVVATGLEHTEGQVLVALFASKEGFPSDIDQALQRGVAQMDSTVATYTFDAVPQGDYSVSVLHDEDGNGEMKTATFGRPAEGWGVSNDAKASFGPPKFESARFSARQDSVTVELKLRY